MKDKILNIMSDIFQCDPSEISDKTSSDDIDTWDSLNHLNLITAIEEEFDVSFDFDEIEEMLNLELILLILNEKINEKT